MEVWGQRVDSITKGEEVLPGFIARDLCGTTLYAALPLSIQTGRELPALPQEASGTIGSRKQSDSKIHESLRKEKGKRRMWDVLRV